VADAVADPRAAFRGSMAGRHVLQSRQAPLHKMVVLPGGSRNTIIRLP
jgi:hypothetical protein